jgi:hypothetical protein
MWAIFTKNLFKVNIHPLGGNSSNLVARCETVLPDGIFSNQKSQFLYIFEGLGVKKFG